MQINERKRNVIVSSRMFKIKMEKKKKKIKLTIELF